MPSSHVPRTQSELQLSLDEQAAEIRDVNMFYRLVNGIRDRHQGKAISSAEGIAGIVQTRLQDVERSYHSADPRELRAVPMPLLTPRVPPVVQFTDANDGWSITGFPGTLPDAGEHRADHHSDGEDDDIFDMDL